MKALTAMLVLTVALAGCHDKNAEAEKARQDAEAKARADAARKEQDSLTKTFQNPDYFKKNTPTPQPTDAEKSK